MFSKLFIAGMIVGLVGCSTDAVSNWVKPEQGTKK